MNSKLVISFGNEELNKVILREVKTARRFNKPILFIYYLKEDLKNAQLKLMKNEMKMVFESFLQIKEIHENKI